ncbi:hypothetical protein ACO0LD_27675 [Undibacterium sp. Ji83W]|uniref:hypothetical protein n=1 Tax=Undibacterium sp. Ji83W TaxID=3413043 RepID=UPI003BF0ECE7
MTKKIAIFVEGYTEQEFTIRLVTEIAGLRGVTFELQEQFQGILQAKGMKSQDPNNEFYVLIVNCCTDNQVKSQIRDQYNSLSTNGYSKIIGLRDVFPFTHTDLSNLRAVLTAGLPCGSTPIDIHLAEMEIEAWFIDERTHYEQIDSTMTVSEIVNRGFDIVGVQGHQWPNPAQTLHAIYKAWGKSYTKKAKHRVRTIDAIDMTEIYVNVRPNAPTLDQFINSIELSLI